MTLRPAIERERRNYDWLGFIGVFAAMPIILFGVGLLARGDLSHGRVELNQVFVDRFASDWRENGSSINACPPIPDDRKTLDDRTDWHGREVRLLCESTPPYRVFVVSPGFDGELGTSDDVASR